MVNTYKKTSNRKTKILAVVLMSAALMFTVLFSLFFIAHELDHDCSGDDCPICAFIHMCENNIRQIGGGASAIMAAVVLAVVIQALPVLTSLDVNLLTPVSSKTRLNN